MKGQSLGPCRIEEELGVGGMGTVHRAVLEESLAGREKGEQVAVKVIHKHLVTRRGSFKRFLREARIGKLIRHENVVATLDMDVDEMDGTSIVYIVMEYVEGRTLRELLQDLETIPEALLREIATQVAAGLAAIHTEGIVHRDLKPENVLITEDHHVRIMDLGIARLIQETIAVTREGEFAGSLLYASPEQIKGGDLTLFGDLYSVGVMLYELATGINPFRLDDVGQVVNAHLHTVPITPAEQNPEISLFLSEVIMKLLGKTRDERFRSAQVLHQVLLEKEASTWWGGRERTLATSGMLPTVSVRRDAALSGRDEELGVLRHAWDAACSGAGNTVFVEGEAGIGKTRLVHEFLNAFDPGATHVLYGSYPPSGGIGGLSEAILDALGSARLDEALSPYLEETPTLVPAFAAMVKHKAPPGGGVALHADALHTLMCNLMKGLAQEKPLLWVVDDLHFADPDSRRILLSMSRAAESSRVLLLVTARPGLPEEELSHFSRAGNFRRVPLGRLSPREVIELVRGAIGSRRLAERLGGKIAYKSDGVPFFVLGMIEDLKEGGYLRQLADGSFEESEIIGDIQVPSAVRDLIQARLEDLTPDERAILDVGAVHGFHFDPDLIARVREMKRVVVLERLAGLERRSGIVRGGGGGCRFDHHQIQELLYQDLMVDLREEYHALIADAYADREGLTGTDEIELSGESAYFLADHYLRSNRPRDSRHCIGPAITHLRRAYRHEAALTLGQSALEAKGLLGSEEREETLLKTATTLDMLGRKKEERAALDEVLALADASEDPSRMARARRGLGWFMLSISRPEEARSWLEESLNLSRSANDRKAEAIATGALGNLYQDLSQFDEAKEHFERHLVIARELGDRSEEGTALGNLGITAKMTGRYDDARTYYEGDLEIARAAGDRRAEGISTGNLGILLSEQGMYEEARKHYTHALEMFREMGYRRGEATLTGNLGVVAKALGLYEESLERHRAQSVLAREIGNPFLEGISHLNMAELETSLGCAESAIDSLKAARGIFQAVGDRRAESYAVHGLGEAEECLGLREEAEARYEEALAVRREISIPRGVMETLSALGRLRLDAGRQKEAGEDLDEALSIARSLDAADGMVLTTARLALLHGGDSTAAMDCFREHDARLKPGVRMEARFLLWRITKDAGQLAKARRLLDHLKQHAPADKQESMVERVPLHRAIVAGGEA